MHKVVDNLLNIKNQLKEFTKETTVNKPKIIAVSKTFSMDKIIPLITYGHLDYGENKVQEAISKWTDIKKKYPSIKLHMIGKLQTNKVKHAVSLFDYIHSLDNIKLAEKIAIEQKKSKRDLKIFIQVNVGNEFQKNGLATNDLKGFYKKCTQELNLNIVGLMCIPPHNQLTIKYFSQMQELNKSINLKELSMGMSEDYIDAMSYGSTYLRLGSKIFGRRV